MLRSVKFGLPAVVLAALAGCSPDYSPNTYNANAVQQANKVEPAVVIGYREVVISASGTIGAVTGGAAGGILGAQAGPGGINSALGAVGGSAAGSLLGSTIERVSGDTTGWEYIVRKSNGELLSLTQREPKPLPIGQKVLVITGNQARIIPDHSLVGDSVPAPKDKAEGKEPLPPAAAAPAPAPTPPPAATPGGVARPAPAPAPATPKESRDAAVMPAVATPPPATPAPEPAPAPVQPPADPVAVTAEDAPPAPEPQPVAAASTGEASPSFWDAFNRNIMTEEPAEAAPQ